MKTKFANAVVRDGYVYGLDDVLLSCVDVETGKVKWKKRRDPEFGHGQIMLVGDVILVLSETGEVGARRGDAGGVSRSWPRSRPSTRGTRPGTRRPSRRRISWCGTRARWPAIGCRSSAKSRRRLWRHLENCPNAGTVFIGDVASVEDGTTHEGVRYRRKKRRVFPKATRFLRRRQVVEATRSCYWRRCGVVELWNCARRTRFTVPKFAHFVTCRARKLHVLWRLPIGGVPKRIEFTPVLSGSESSKNRGEGSARRHDEGSRGFLREAGVVIGAKNRTLVSRTLGAVGRSSLGKRALLGNSSNPPRRASTGIRRNSPGMERASRGVCICSVVDLGSIRAGGRFQQ